jgi:hypothetical protein
VSQNPAVRQRWVPAFWKCAYLASPRAAGTAYFVAADHTRAKAEADAFFGRNASAWYPQEITRGHVRGHVTALVDVLVLSMCDHLVTTSMSTFGYIAAGLASRAPAVVNFDGSCLQARPLARVFVRGPRRAALFGRTPLAQHHSRPGSFFGTSSVEERRASDPCDGAPRGQEASSQPCFHKWSYLFGAECYDPHEMVSPEVRRRLCPRSCEHRLVFP